MIDIFFWCWLILLPNGDVLCRCEVKAPTKTPRPTISRPVVEDQAVSARAAGRNMARRPVRE